MRLIFVCDTDEPGDMRCDIFYETGLNAYIMKSHNISVILIFIINQFKLYPYCNMKNIDFIKMT